MSHRMEDLIDEIWQTGSKFSVLGYLKNLCFKALYMALVGSPHPSGQPMAIRVPAERISRR